jgi:serine/threonine protein phosphatase PrpC
MNGNIRSVAEQAPQKFTVYSYSLQGRRDTQEDQHIAVLNLNGDKKDMNNINLFGVFDGHGGKKVSHFLKNNLPNFFLSKFEKNIFKKNETFTKYTNEVYNLLQTNLKEKHPRAVEYCGSTACIGIQTLDKKDKNILWIVNVGDSRAVLCNKNGEGVQLSVDHKPNLPEEKKRIEQLGGKITYDGSDWRVKSLSLSRAFGDLDCCPYVTHLPNIYKYKIDPKDKFLIVACDGLWDSLSNKVAVEFIRDLQFKNFTGNYAKELANYGLLKGSYDNITVVIYFF